MNFENIDFMQEAKALDGQLQQTRIMLAGLVFSIVAVGLFSTWLI